MSTVAQVIAGFISQNGIRWVFGVPGGENVLLIEALRQAGVEYVLMHHEAAAGFAADVQGQLTGLPGVCMSTVGPGALNLLSGVSSANLERSPVLAITAEIEPSQSDRIAHMNVDLEALFTAGTKGSLRITPANCREQLDYAWDLAMQAPRGAVNLRLSLEASGAPAGTVNTRPHRIVPKTSSIGSISSNTDDPSIEDLKGIIESSELPFFLVGQGVETAGAQDSLQSLAEEWGTPVAVTPKAKGHFPDDHPLYCGCYSAYGDGPLRQMVEDADLIIGIGLDGSDLVTSTWDVQTALVNLSPGEANDPVYRPRLAINGDLNTLLSSLAGTRELDPSGTRRSARIRDDILLALETGAGPTSGKIRLLELIGSLREAAPRDTIASLDVGIFKLVFLQAWPVYGPKSFFVANGMSAMGYSIPGAVAAKLNNPDKPVAAVIGDGALLMYAGELATVARLRLPIVILVVVDEALALIRLKQFREGLPIQGTEFKPIDYAKLATAFGIDYRLVDGPENAVDLLSRAIEQPHPILVEARINIDEYDHFM